MSTTIGESKTNILKLLFFTLNLHFVKSNQISPYRKLNLSLTSSIYFVFLPLEMQKRLKQTKVYHSFSYFVWKEMTHKPGSCKNSFLQGVRYWYSLLQWLFFILYDNWKTLLFLKICYSETFEAPSCCFLWIQCFERSPHFMCCLHNNKMMLIQKFQSKAD